MAMIVLFDFLPEAIFEGALTITFVLIFATAFRIKTLFNYTISTQTINITLLASAVLNLILFVFTCVKAFVGGEYGRYVFLNRFLGPHWYAGCIILFVWTFLPQVLWFGKARKSTAWLLSIIMVQLLFKLMLFAIQLEIMLERDFSSWAMIPTISVVEYMEHVGVYLVLVSLIYYGLLTIKRQDTVKVEAPR